MESYLNNAEILITLKQKESEVSALLKIKQKYECELEVLRESLLDKEYRLKRVTEDNIKLKEKL